MSEPADLQPGGLGDRSRVAAVILTAGRGTRMRSSLPKTLHPLAGIPMAEHVVRAARAINPGQIIVTVGPTSAPLQDVLRDVDFAWQPDALGTGDAARVALPHLNAAIEWVVVLFGDAALLSGDMLADIVDTTISGKPLLSSVAVTLEDPGPYGRYRRDDVGNVIGIVEAHEDDTVYSGPVDVNSGVCCVQRVWLEQALPRLTLSPKGEYYLTELVAMAAAEGRDNAVSIVHAPAEIAVGINNRAELAYAESILRKRINHAHMLAGVTLVDPERTYIDADVSIGADTRIEPGTRLIGATDIGSNCRIGPDTTIEHSEIGDHVVIRSSWIEHSEVGEHTDIGPYAHLRPGTVLAPHVHIGNYVEIKAADIGSGTAIGHFSYVGDATVGERVNIGAGTITANFDGKAKHRTVIGDDVFVGSDTTLRAPVTLGDGSATGAGAVVTKDVPPGKLVVGIPARVAPRRSTPSEQEEIGE